LSMCYALYLFTNFSYALNLQLMLLLSLTSTHLTDLCTGGYDEPNNSSAAGVPI
jgi:hypothetical protein